MAVTFVRGLGLAVGLCLLASSALAGTRWEHPWLPDRMFDYRHSDWAGGDPLSWFGYHYREAEATFGTWSGPRRMSSGCPTSPSAWRWIGSI